MGTGTLFGFRPVLRYRSQGVCHLSITAVSLDYAVLLSCASYEQACSALPSFELARMGSNKRMLRGPFPGMVILLILAAPWLSGIRAFSGSVVLLTEAPTNRLWWAWDKNRRVVFDSLSLTGKTIVSTEVGVWVGKEEVTGSAPYESLFRLKDFTVLPSQYLSSMSLWKTKSSRNPRKSQWGDFTGDSKFYIFYALVTLVSKIKGHFWFLFLSHCSFKDGICLLPKGETECEINICKLWSTSVFTDSCERKVLQLENKTLKELPNQLDVNTG